MSDWDKYESAAERGPLPFILKIILPVVAICLVIGAAGHFLGWCGSGAEIVDKTLSADNVIYNYEYFKQSFQDIKAMDAKIVDAQSASDKFDHQYATRKEMDRDDKTESDRLHSIVLGLQQERQNQVATYNARSQMANRQIFKSGDLPSHIDN
jgi:hypothetical protein